MNTFRGPEYKSVCVFVVNAEWRQTAGSEFKGHASIYLLHAH